MKKEVTVKVESKKIFFLSYSKHQYKFFRFLRDNLKSGAAILLSSFQCFIRGIFIRQDELFSQEDIDKIVKYSFLKFKARRQQNREDFLNRAYYQYLLYKTRILSQYYYRCFRDNNIDLVVVWNGFHMEAASCVKVAHVLGIKTIFMENGYFPQTLVMDEKGVNAVNSLAGKGAQFYQKVQVDQEKLAQLYDTKLQQVKLRKRYFGKEEIEYPRNFFFLPFQVLTDTQVLLNSPHIRNMYELVDIVYSALERFNCINNEDFWLVIKEHPCDFGRVDYSDLKKKYQNKKVVFTITTPSSRLIELSKAVITINSTVGIEALLKRKAVITLGKDFYNVEGLVHHCNDLLRLHEFMAKALSEKINNELLDKFLYFLRYEYLVEIDRKNLTKDNIKPVLERLEKFWHNN